MTTNYFVDTVDGNNANAGTARDGSAWASLNYAESQLPGTFSDDYAIHCAGSTQDSTSVTFSGSGASATHGLVVYADRAATDSDGFYGGAQIFSTGHYSITGTGSFVISVSQDYVTLDGLQIELTSTTNGAAAISIPFGTANTRDVKRCGIYGNADTGGQYGINNDSMRDGSITFDSNVICNFGAGGAGYAIRSNMNPAYSGTCNIFNQTIVNCDGGIIISDGSGAGTPVVNLKNNVLHTIANTEISHSVTVTTVNFDYNAGEDDYTGSDAHWATLSTTASNVFNSPGSFAKTNDVHLTSGSGAADSGTNIGETNGRDDVARASPYDRGAYNFASSSSPTVSPSAGSLSFTGYAPTPSVSSSGQTVTPSVGSIAFTSYAPSISFTTNKIVNPSVGSATFTGYAPSISVASGQVLTPSNGAITITGLSPTISLTQKYLIKPNVGNTALTGYAPTANISDNHIVIPGADAIVVTGYIPSITTNSFLVLPTVGAIAVSGYQPTISRTTNSIVTGIAGSITFSGYIPVLVSQSQWTEINTGTSTWTEVTTGNSETWTEIVTP